MTTKISERSVAQKLRCATSVLWHAAIVTIGSHFSLQAQAQPAPPPPAPQQDDIGPVTIEIVAIISVAFGGHKAGNMEIRTSGFPDPPIQPPPGWPANIPWTPPPGPTRQPLKVKCDRTYITTLKTAESFQQMVNLLTLAQANMQPVYLRITDDSNPSVNAYVGRCSLMSVAIGQ